MPNIKITLVRSPIGCSQRQKRTVEALGLRRMHHSVVQPANLQILGMVRKIPHLVHVEEVDEVDVPKQAEAR